MREGKDSNLGLELQKHYGVGESLKYQSPGGHFVPNPGHAGPAGRVALDEFNRGSDRCDEVQTQAGRRCS